MKAIIYVWAVVIINSCGITKAQQNTISAKKEQQKKSPVKAVQQGNLPAGKYLVLMQNANQPKNEKKIPLQITSNGTLTVFFASKRKPMPLARVKSAKNNEFHLEFSPLFDSGLSGNYTLKHLPQNHFKLTSKNGEMLFFPFNEQEVAVNNKTKKDIVGKWRMKNNEEEIIFQFYLPNKLHIQKNEKYEQTASDVFWVSQVNGEAITVASSVFFSVFSGTLEQVKIKGNELHFTYKGKLYKMNKQPN